MLYIAVALYQAFQYVAPAIITLLVGILVLAGLVAILKLMLDKWNNRFKDSEWE